MAKRWSDLAMRGVEADNRRAAHHRDATRSSSLGIHLTHHMHDLLRQAAKERGMSKASYVRRALAAFVAHDTGEDFRKILQECPPVAPWDQRNRAGLSVMRARRGQPVDDWYKPHDDGEGYGTWEVK